MTLPLHVRYYGEDSPLPEQTPLRAGPLSLIYEAGDLRYIRLGSHELLRRVYVAVRDQNWETAPSQIHNLQMEIAEDHFHIRYDVVNLLGDVDFVWQGVITGDAEGTIRFSMDGQALSTFLRNRIGFCVLHPMACAGMACRINHVDAAVDNTRFPVHIAPQRMVDGIIKPVAPFEEMRSLAHEVLPGLWAEVQFEGEIFEMEDQRNWTDASFKTYGTPLRLPFPVEVSAGTQIRQTVTLSLTGSMPAAAVGKDDQPTITIAASSYRTLPRLGLGMASHGQPLDGTAVTHLQRLNLAHLRVDLVLADPSHVAALRQSAEEAQAVCAELEVALLLSERAEDELRNLADHLAEIRPPVARWLIFHGDEATTSARWVALARAVLSAYDRSAAIGAGTNIYFTDLNRDRPDAAAWDFITYSFNPQVHAFDNASLVETLATQSSTVMSARQFTGDVPIIVSPVTLKPRFNPNSTGPEPEPVLDTLPSQVDVRQMSLLGAGWTVGSLKYLCESGVEAVTYYETTGWRGVMEMAGPNPLPDRFCSIPGAVFPLFHVLADVGEFKGGEVVPTLSSHPLQVEALSLKKNHRVRTLVANLSPAPQALTVHSLPETVHFAMLDETNMVAAVTEPERYRRESGTERSTTAGALSFTLPPYAIARIDSV